MPKTKKIVTKSTVKSTKQKLTPEQRSQIAKDRWAKRRELVAETNTANADKITVTWPESGTFTISTETPATPPSVVVTVNSPVPDPPVPHEIAMANLAAQGVADKSMALAESMYESIPAAPQLAPVKAPKQKRYTGPKEFSVALKAAEGRLAKAIIERAQAAGQLAALQAEIPSLLGIINALKGPQGFAQPTPYNYAESFPNAQAFQAPLSVPSQFQYPQNPLDAIQAAQPAPPVSRAQGGAMQFSPEMVGTLEGPEDDDMDKYISGPAAGGSGWIGG